MKVMYNVVNSPSIKGWMKKGMVKKAKFLIRQEETYDTDDTVSDSMSNLSEDNIPELSQNMLGNCLNKRYIILKYLGKGTFSRVWMAYDLNEYKYVAIKIFNIDEDEDADYEISMLNKINTNDTNDINDKLVKLYNTFNYISTPINKTHKCLVLELTGISLLDLLLPYDKLSIKEFKIISKEILLGMDQYFTRNIIHNDIKLENIMTMNYSNSVKAIINWFDSLNIKDEYNNLIISKLPDDYNSLPADKRKKIKKKIKEKIMKEFIDNIKSRIIVKQNQDSLFYNLNDNDVNDDAREENSIPIDENLKLIITDFNNSSTIDNDNDYEIQYRSYRPPENIINSNFNQLSDIWSLGCVLYEVITDNILFDSEEDSDNKDQHLLSLMYKYLGKFPRDMTTNYKLFDNDGNIKGIYNINYSTLENKLKEDRPDLTDEEIKSISNLLYKMLKYNPNERLTPKQLLDDSFLII
jgi:serine/threonine-protein kinase SRPK3